VAGLLLAACSSDDPDATAGNRLPQAAAGPDQRVDEQIEVTLDGSFSSDPDGPLERFSWRQLGGPLVTIEAPTSAVTRFVAPPVGIARTLTFELTVVDSSAANATDLVEVIVEPVAGLNLAPLADAGVGRTVSELGSVILDGTGSEDPDGLISTFAWVQTHGPPVSLSQPGSSTPSFTAPRVAAPTLLTFELTVTDNEGAVDSSRVTLTVVPAGIVTLSGTVSFERVPVSSACGFPAACLDYGGTEIVPARRAPIQVIDAADGVTVLAGGTTDDNGRFRFSVQNFVDVFLRARAQQLGPDRAFSVRDNTNQDALYVVDGSVFNTGSADLEQDLHAASGWTGNGYGAARAAAPFAILDVVYAAVALVQSADPAASFPPLDIHWSPSNRPCDGCTVDVSSGRLATSFYRGGPGGGIFLLGDENVDTDEYDIHVIAHEWAHYLEDTFSRSDSIGGPHTRGDQLDLRVAFGEGWGNALAAIITGDTLYKDTLGPGQAAGFNMEIEGEARRNPGWYSEASVQELLYDFYDGIPDVQRGTTVVDAVNLGFAPLFEVFVNAQRTTSALTSLFPFVNALKLRNPAAAAAIDALTDVHRIAAIDDDFGSSEANAGDPASADVLPIYASLTVDGGPVNVCSSDEFSLTFTGAVNKLGSRRFLRFVPATSGRHTIRVTTTSAPSDASADPDLWLHQSGPIAFSNAAPSESCTPTTLEQCVETMSRTLQAGAQHVIEVYEWTNTNSSDDPDFPPIGRACFDVEVTR